MVPPFTRSSHRYFCQWTRDGNGHPKVRTPASFEKKNSTGPVRIYLWKDDFNRGYICYSSADSKIHLRLHLPSNGDYKVNVDRGSTEAEIDYDVKFSIH